MKSTIISFFLCLFFCNYLHGQYRLSTPQPPAYEITNRNGATLGQIIDTMYARADPTDTDEGGGIDQISIFKSIWQGRVVANDSSGVNMFQEYYNGLRNAAAARIASPCSGGGAWQQAGPGGLQLQTSGYTNAVWADTGSDSNYILAGTIYGGLFKTTDGGQHWSNLTDGAPIAGGLMGVNNIAVNTRNINTIYLGTVGAAILESFDRGAHWVQEFITLGGSTIADSTESTFLYITEDSTRLYAICGKRVYTRPTGSSTWVNITPPIPAVNIIGWNTMAFVPGRPDTFFVAGQYLNSYKGIGDTAVLPYSATTGIIWKSIVPIPDSSQWVDVSSLLVDSFLNRSGHVTGSGFIYDTTLVIYHDTDMTLFNLCAPDTNNLYVICIPILGSIYGANSGLFKYHYNSDQWTKISQNVPGQDQFRFELSVSPADSNIIYFGTLQSYFSDDGGDTFNLIGQYWGEPTHGDIRAMYLQKSTAGENGKMDRLYLANDGGLSLKPSGVDMVGGGANSTTDISGTGLACGTYWSFSTGEAGGLGMGGMMHDGIVTYEPKQGQPWKSVGSSDAWGCAIDKSDPLKAYGWLWSNVLDVTDTSGGRTMDTLETFPQPDLTQDPGFGGIGKSIETDVSGNIYCVGSDFWRKRPMDVRFLDMYNPPAYNWGFPDRAIGDTFFGAMIALNPYDTTFEGYVLYNTNTDTQHVYYRNFAIPRFTSAHEIANPVPGSSTYPIVCMATNPNNTEQVWVTLGGTDVSTYSDGTRYRVEYSPDHGSTWIDVSNGLPQYLPAGRIIYDEGAGVLYCSTDVGIYKCDFNNFIPGSTYTNTDGNLENSTSQWTCFSKGLDSNHNFPNTTVTDLRINHCQGKLYAATYGRSIWSTDIYTPGTLLNGTCLTLTSSQTWSGGNQYMTGNVVIDSGATLTLSDDTLHMPKGGSIIVQPGGKLNVRYSEITNDCGNLWKGIQVRGQTGQPQLPTTQGWAVLNHALLQFADTAISNFNPAVRFGATGGVIQAMNSYFIDDHNSATFIVYDNWHGDTLYPNLSYFLACNFVLDNNYPGNSTGYYTGNMVSLGDVEGIAFTGCNFRNTDTFAFQKHKGDGIDVIKSGVSVAQSTFSGFTNGVSVAGVLGYDPTMSLDRCYFDTVSVGVYVSAQNNVSATRCNFHVGHGDGVVDATSLSFSGCYQNIGIMIQNAPHFVMEDNGFTGVPVTPYPNWYNYGTVIDNTGEVTNQIYYNTFDSLATGVYAIGGNKYESADGGLEIYCNTFFNNNNDIFVASDGGMFYNQGIQPDQGSFGEAAGNTFSGSVNNITNTGDLVYYWNQVATSEHPLYTTTTTVVSMGSIGTSCSPPVLPPIFHKPYIGPGGGTGSVDMGTLRAYKDSFYNYQSAFKLSMASMSHLMDYGNTDSLLYIIDTCHNNVMMYTILVTAVPFLSEAALEKVADSVRLTYPQVFNILLQTPDDLLDPAFLSYMNNAYSFSPGDLATLQAVAGTLTARTTLQGILNVSQSNAANYGNLVLIALKSPLDSNVSVMDTTGGGVCMDSTSIYYLLDSNNIYVNLDSVDQWLQNIGGLWTNYERVGYYNFLGNTTVADSIFSGISSSIPVTGSPGHVADSTEYAVYTRLWTVMKSADSAGRDIFDLNSTEIAELDTTSTPDNSNNTPEQMIVNVTNIISGGAGTGNIACPTYGYRESNPYGHNQLQGNMNISNPKTEQFSVYPNPASGLVTFSYNTPGGGDITITVMDLLGEKVMEQHPVGTTGIAYWNSGNVPPGIYIYRASNLNGVIGMGKIVILAKQ